MTWHENKTTLAAIFSETAKGNGRPFFDALANDVKWTIIGSTAWSRTYVGKVSVLNDLCALWGSSSVAPASSGFTISSPKGIPSSSRPQDTMASLLERSARTPIVGSFASAKAR